MKTIVLHGYLKEAFGESYRFDVPTPAMAVRALTSQVKGIRDAIANGEFGVIMGKRDTGFQLDETELQFKFGQCEELHLVPVVGGAGGKTGGIIKTIIGVALLGIATAGAALAPAAGLLAGYGATAFSAFGVAVSWGTIAGLGVGMAVTGITSALTPRVDVPNSGRPGSYDSREQADNRPSFLFNGPVNRVEQGGCVPVVYGKVRTGSIVISAGISTEQI